MLLPWTIAAAVCAAIPASLTLLNLREYLPPPLPAAGLPNAAVVIPVRNEAAGIFACLESVLRSTGLDLQVIVVDDESTDGTAEIVQFMANRDSRVRLVSAGPLPSGWTGKQHACAVGADAANAAFLCFLDADVRLQPQALSRMLTLLLRDRAALVSGFPLEQTGTLLEKLLIPLIHFVLLGLLPMSGLRRTAKPAYAAGCGQFLMVDRSAYFVTGGHAAIRHTMHDGLLLPRLIRQHGLATRLADMTGLAECRMYQSAGTTWRGLSKNATEGLATPGRILPITALLLLGQVLPALLVWLAWHRTTFILPFLGPPVRIGLAAVWWAAAALFLNYVPRIINTIRYRQSWLGAALHPIGVLLLLVLQWEALIRKWLGRPAGWKARAYQAQ